MAVTPAASAVTRRATPQNTTRYNYTKQRFEFFRAFADGYYDFIPGGAIYRGNGYFQAGSESEAERLSHATQDTFDFQRIHDLLRQTVTKAPCATFIRRILKSVSSEGNPLVERGDLEQLFFSVLNQKKGGFTRNAIPGGAGFGSVDGYIKGNGQGNAVIFLPEFPDASLRNWSDAQGAIGELMHLAGKNWYSDYDLAVAVNAIPEYASEFRGSAENNPFDPSYDGNAKDKNSGGYSSFFHGVQRRICEVPKED